MPTRANSIRRGSTIFYAGVDVGGTFTDIVVFNEESPADVQIKKLSTTAGEPENAVIEALGQYRKSADQFSLLTHATTVGTNALLTHTGLAKTALVTNREFRDVLEIARQRRPEIYSLKTERPKPLVPRKDRFTIKGRILWDGSVAEQLDIREVERIAKKIVASKFEAVAISLLNSYVNPTHEIDTQRSIRAEGFKGPIYISSEVDPEYREYERTSTTVVNASLSRSVSTYLERLESKLKEAGFQCSVYVMNSDGTASTIGQASRRPISLIESGPAAGALASGTLAAHLGIKNALTFDMGGTTAKAGTVIDYRPQLAFEFEAAAKTYHGRSIKGSGYPVRQPFIDLAEVSAGGGTIAWLDETGNLRVGPESAGSDPGPAAYGKGGRQPTITDANIILGRINPTKLLGGDLTVHYDLAIQAIRTISRRLKASIDRMSESIIRLVNDNMSKALRIVTIERGLDPRDFTLIAFGGAGPLHACDLAEELEIKRIIVPLHPGLFSAFGLLTADLSRSISEPILKRLSSNIESYFHRAREHARELLKQEGFRNYRTVEEIDLRYWGQAYEITVPYKKGTNLAKLFGREHRKLYGYSARDPVEAVNARVRAIIDTPKATLIKKRLARSKPPANHSSRRALFRDGFASVPVYDRDRLTPGVSGKGPCIIEEYDSTTVVGNGWAWKVDEYGNIDMRPRRVA
jgi:N-methylhydantoinase A